MNGNLYNFITLCFAMELPENKILHIVSDMFMLHKENPAPNFGVFRFFSLLLDSLYLNGEKLITMGALEPCKTQESLESIGSEYDFKDYAEQYPEGFEYYDYDSMLDSSISSFQYFRTDRLQNKFNSVDILLNKVYENINSEMN